MTTLDQKLTTVLQTALDSVLIEMFLSAPSDAQFSTLGGIYGIYLAHLTDCGLRDTRDYAAQVARLWNQFRPEEPGDAAALESLALSTRLAARRAIK